MASRTSPRSRKGDRRRQEFPSSSTLGSFWEHHPAVNLQSVEDILDRKLREGQGHDEATPSSRSGRDRRYEVSPDQLGSFVGHKSGLNSRPVDDVTTQGATGGGQTSVEDTSRSNASQEWSEESQSYSTLGSRPSPVDLQSVENIISQRYGGTKDTPRSSAWLPVSQDRTHRESPSYSTLGPRLSPVDLQSVETQRYKIEEDAPRSSMSQESPSYSTLGSRPSPINLQSMENVLSHRYGVTIPHSDLPSRSSSKTSVSQETPSSSTLGSTGTSRRRSLINLRSIEDVIRKKFRSFRHRSSSSVDGSNMAPFVQASSNMAQYGPASANMAPFGQAPSNMAPFSQVSSNMAPYGQASSNQTLPMSLHPSDVTFGSSTEAGLSDFKLDEKVWDVDSDITSGIRASSRQGQQGYSTMPSSGYFSTNRPAVFPSQSSHAGSTYAPSSASSEVSMETSVPMETPSATSLRDLLGWEDEISDQDSDSDSESQLYDPTQYKYCYRCDGIGITHSDDTWHWAPSRELPCHFCRRCTTCKGNGIIPINSNICHRCEGKGFLHGSPAAHTQTGRVRCLLCEDCCACEGKGVMPVGRALCAQCRGRGAVHAGGWAEVPHRARRTQRCFFCTKCDWCNGKGAIQTGYTLS
ncbi:uncharacterized protein LOC144860063 [Branchiostoma floridae x Branchiostoma japonicum]